MLSIGFLFQFLFSVPQLAPQLFNAPDGAVSPTPLGYTRQFTYFPVQLLGHPHKAEIVVCVHIIFSPFSISKIPKEFGQLDHGEAGNKPKHYHRRGCYN
jgi:hypothetical protein